MLFRFRSICSVLVSGTSTLKSLLSYRYDCVRSLCSLWYCWEALLKHKTVVNCWQHSSHNDLTCYHTANRDIITGSGSLYLTWFIVYACGFSSGLISAVVGLELILNLGVITNHLFQFGCNAWRWQSEDLCAKKKKKTKTKNKQKQWSKTFFFCGNKSFRWKISFAWWMLNAERLDTHLRLLFAHNTRNSAEVMKTRWCVHVHVDVCKEFLNIQKPAAALVQWTKIVSSFQVQVMLILSSVKTCCSWSATGGQWWA